METIKEKLSKIRHLLKKQELRGFIIPHDDEFKSENLPSHAERLGYISGFTGSAGTAIILDDKACLFVDGRYKLQAPQQTDETQFDIYDIKDKKPIKWLEENLKENDKIGYDGWLLSLKEKKELQDACKKIKAEAFEVKKNLVDEIWKDKPKKKTAKIQPHFLKYCGKKSKDKIKEIVDILVKKNAQSLVLTNPASISWLLNIRGDDVDFSPLVHCFLVLHKDETADLIIDENKLDKKIKKHLGENIRIYSFENADEKIKETLLNSNSVLVDDKTIPVKIINQLEKTNIKIIKDNDPCEFPKAIKNKTEIRGAKNSHIRDAISMINFLYWFEKNAKYGNQTELSVSKALDEFRSFNHLYKGKSFATIAGAGSNGAIVHYSASEKTNKKIENNMLLLLDSGGQYLDGTTDVTRTIAVGKPTKEQKRRYTQVLMGHIDLSLAKFPKDITGANLDILARKHLFKEGLDYAHGTGHGVGSYLNVHEGPCSISMKNHQPIKEGMIFSNEPGFYKQGEFGIRIENLIYTKKHINNMLCFENLTLVPYDKRLIEKGMLSAEHIKYINNYHNKILKVIYPLLSSNKVKNWLKKITKPI